MMKALRRISLSKRIVSLSRSATVIKNTIPTHSKSIFSSSPIIPDHDDKNINKNINNNIRPLLATATAAAAAAITPLTPAGYAIPTIGVTVLSNLPLAAFAFVQASGISPIREILKNGSTGDYSPFPFVSLFTNCSVWTLYGVLQQDQTILIANTAGTIMGLIYTAIFAMNTKISMSKYYISSGSLLSIFLTAPLWSNYVNLDASNILGTFGMSTAVVLMASPLAVVGTVIKTKSTNAMPFPVSLAMTLNGSCWFSYGWFVTADPYIWIPNILGAASGLVQLSLFVIY